MESLNLCFGQHQDGLTSEGLVRETARLRSVQELVLGQRLLSGALGLHPQA